MLASLRKHKILGLAVFDLVSSLVGMVILFVLMQKWHFPKLKTSRFVIAALVLAIPLGVIVHVIFGVNTSLNQKLGLSYNP